MSDVPDPLLHVLRRIADALGPVEQRLPALATEDRLQALSDRIDEYRVRSRTEVGHVLEVATALGNAVEVLLREQQALAGAVQAAGSSGSGDAGALDRLVEATRALRDDLAEVHGELRSLGARVDALPTADPGSLQGVYDRLGGIEWRLGERLDPLDSRLAELERRLDQPSSADPRVLDRLGALEAAIDQLAQRDDLRRGVDRVLGAVAGAEESLTGEVRAVDQRIGAIAEEVRVVRVLRDGLEALADGVDGIRQLAARSATSQQMTEVTRELGSVLAEIEHARSQVLRVERSPSPVAADVVTVGADVDQLGRRIDDLADALAHRAQDSPAEPAELQAVHQVTQRLRQVSSSARLLGNGVLEELRSRQRRRR